MRLSVVCAVCVFKEVCAAVLSDCGASELTDPCTTELIDVGAYVLRDTNVVIFVNVVLQNDKAYPAMEDKEIQ